ncbi:MAG: peptidylprolyl isomerase, partial [Rhodobacterales bacterium]|nr:peptidylprolyl isomerase [Rhodobacterales bacterium]
MSEPQVKPKHKPLMPDVSVNGEDISAADIAAEAQNHHAPKGKPGLAWRAGARALVIRALLLQEARKRDLQPNPREIEAGKFETDEESMMREVMELGVVPDAPDDARIKAIYESNPEQFRAPSLYEPAHILFAADPEDMPARADARAKAVAALQTLASAPRDFTTLAAELSDCPSRDAGGQLGQISSGDTVPEFEAALDALAAGEMAPEPVESRYGFHVV